MQANNLPDLLFSASINAPADDPESFSLILKTCQFDYLVTFTDGTREHYLLIYEARIWALKSSQAMTPGTGRPAARNGDTPPAAYRWRYRGYLTRRVAMVNRAGEHFESTGFGRSIDISDSGGSEDAAWAIWRERAHHQPSKPSPAELEPAITPLNLNFERLVVTDKHRMNNYFRHGLGAVTSVSEMD